MNRIVISDRASRYTRITKLRARVLFATGKPFYIIAHKMRPGFPFSMGMTIDPLHYTAENVNFDAMVNNFSFYNCSHETGAYPAFYSVSEN